MAARRSGNEGAGVPEGFNLAMALLDCLMMAPAVFEPGFVQLPYFHIFFCSFPDILRRILGIDAEFHARIGQLFIDFPEECRDLVKQAVP